MGATAIDAEKGFFTPVSPFTVTSTTDATVSPLVRAGSVLLAPVGVAPPEQLLSPGDIADAVQIVSTGSAAHAQPSCRFDRK